jgi:hypothetical protein
VERRQRRQLRDRLRHGGVHDHGLAEAGAAVDDAMADGVGTLERLDGRAPLPVVHERELQARRPCIDDEDVQDAILDRSG